MPHSPITALVGTTCSLHQRSQNTVRHSPKGEERSGSSYKGRIEQWQKRKVVNRKNISKQSGKTVPKLSHLREPPEPPPPQTLLISSLALGSSILLLIC